MTIGKQLTQFATYSVTMAAVVALCLWVLFVPLGVDRLTDSCKQVVCHPVPKPVLAPVDTPAIVTREPVQAPVGIPSITITTGPAHAPGDRDSLVRQMKDALSKKGYSIGLAIEDGNDNTLTALEAFQDNHALPVRPTCDQQCWTALGLSGDPR
jgi:hypothetical protein